MLPFNLKSPPPWLKAAPAAGIYAGGSVRTVSIGSSHDGPVTNALHRDKERDHDCRYNARVLSIQVDI